MRSVSPAAPLGGGSWGPLHAPGSEQGSSCALGARRLCRRGEGADRSCLHTPAFLLLLPALPFAPLPNKGLGCRCAGCCRCCSPQVSRGQPPPAQRSCTPSIPPRPTSPGTPSISPAGPEPGGAPGLSPTAPVQTPARAPQALGEPGRPGTPRTPLADRRSWQSLSPCYFLFISGAVRIMEQCCLLA